MPDAKVIQLRPRTYQCSFTTSSDAAVAHLALTAARFGVEVAIDVRAEPSDVPGEAECSPLSPSEGFAGSGVRLEL